MTAAGRPGLGLGPGGEFDLVRDILAPGADVREALPATVLVGPGDDAAVLAPGDGSLVWTCDLAVEGVHFRREWISPEEAGWRAAMAALSDLAAMAAEPVGVLLALGASPGDARAGVALEAARGVRRAVESLDGALVGGDVTRSPGPLVLDVTALGRAARPVTRDGARPGDEVWVTGRLGAAAAAVAAWEAGGEPDPGHRRAYAAPRARVREALRLAGTGALRALIDLSDGLAGDAGHVAAASGVAVALEAHRVPVAAGVEAAVGGGERALETALGGGEDYELCLVAAAGALDAARDDFEAGTGVPLTRVGRIEEGEGVWLEGAGRERVRLDRGGFDHFAPGKPR